MTAAAVAESTHDDHVIDAHEEHGLTFKNAVNIAVFLAVVTGIEVLTYFWDFGDFAVPVLIILMIVKFAVVVAYFMHLRFENWLFTALFVGGLVLAVAVYLAALTASDFWS